MRPVADVSSPSTRLSALSEQTLPSGLWRGFGATLLVTLTLTGTVGAAAAGPSAARRSRPVWRNSLTDAWSEAQRTGRPLLLFVTMPGCGYCRKMKQTTLADRSVQEDLRSRFVAVAIDRQRDAEYIRRMRIQSFPTTVIIHPNGTLLDAIRGYQSAQDYRKRLGAASRQASSRRLHLRG